MADLYDHVDVKFLDWENLIVMEPLPSYEAFKIMESYAIQLSDNEDYKNKLFDALDRNNPFHNFRLIIESSPYRDNWFKFKRAYLQREVKDELDFLLKDE